MRAKRTEYHRKWKAKFRAENRELTNDYARLMAYAFGRERAVKRSKEWRKNNPEKHKALLRKWRDDNRNWVNECCRKWKKDHAPEVATSQRKYHLANLDKAKDRKHRRRSLEVAGTTENCYPKIRLLKAMQRFCHWCCTRLTDTNFTVDHVIPLTRGGLHCSDNLVAACRHCNTSRGNKLVSEWEWQTV